MFDVGQHQDAPEDIGKHRCECHRSQRQLGLDPFSNEAYREVSDVHCAPAYSLEASTRDRLSWYASRATQGGRALAMSGRQRQSVRARV